MTWLKSDSAHKGASDPLSKRSRTPVPREPLPEQPALLDAEGEPTMSVFQAMGVGNGEGIWGTEEGARFPAEMERELARDHGWMPERGWELTRRMMFRDIEAV